MKKLHFGLLILLLAAFVACFLISGCVTMKGPNDSYCSSIQEGQYSVLCLVAERLNSTPEAAAAILKLSNVTMLATDKYSAREALGFIDGIDIYLKQMEFTGVTYKMVMQAFMSRYAKLTPAVQSLFVVFEGAVKIDVPEITMLPLTVLDFSKIYNHLAEQRAVIMPFLLQS